MKIYGFIILISSASPEFRPEPNRGRKEFIYYGSTNRIPEGAAVNTKNTSFTITSELNIPEGGAEGMIITQGGWFAGFGLMLLDGKPTFTYAKSHYPQDKYTVRAPDKLGKGKHLLQLKFDYDGGGAGKGATASILVDGKEVTGGRINETVPTRYSMTEGLEIGRDAGMPESRI